MPTTKLLIVQQYVPSYRVALFEQLRDCLHESGIDLRVAYSTPSPQDAARVDTADLPEFGIKINTRRICIRGNTVSFKNVTRPSSQVKPDFIIVEQATKNLENWAMLIRSFLPRGVPIAFWGPGRAPVSSIHSEYRGLKRVMTNLGSWFFAYTTKGAELVASQGFDKTRITVVNNSLDTKTLQNQMEQITQERLQEWESQHQLTSGRIGLFLGGVDSRKGIDFLLEAAGSVAERLPGFVLLVGGEGEETQKVIELQQKGAPVRYLGRVDGMEKALALKSSTVLMIPEWVGLVAVDAIGSATPLVSTKHPSHAPEFDYLEDGQTCLVTDHNVESYANSIASLLQDPQKLKDMQSAATIAAVSLQLSTTVQNFSAGIKTWTHSHQKYCGKREQR